MNKEDSLTSINPETWAKKEIVKLRTNSVILFVVIFVAIGILTGYYFFSDTFKGPFTKITYAATSSEELQIEVGTKFPARTRIEYGTNSAYVNSISMNNTFQTDHKGEVNGLLPGAPHMFRIVAQDSAGRFHYSQFILVK